MPRVITIPAVGNDDAIGFGVTLDGLELRLLLRWMPRLSRWWCETRTAAGELIESSPISCNSPVWGNRRDPRLPGGALVAIGPDPYLRTDLGGAVLLTYADAVDLA